MFCAGDKLYASEGLEHRVKSVNFMGFYGMLILIYFYFMERLI